MSLWVAVIPITGVLVAFILLLLVSLGVPIIKTIYLFQIANGPDGVITHFGLWGACVQFIAGGGAAATPNECATQFAYELDLSGDLNDPATVSKGLTGSFIIHPIAALMTVFTFGFILISVGTRSLPLTLISLFFGLLALAMAIGSFVVDIVAVNLVHGAVQFSEADTSTSGGGTWMTLVAAILLGLADLGIIAVAYTIRRRRGTVRYK